MRKRPPPRKRTRRPGDGSGGKGILFVVSAPSGTGKSTLARRLLGGMQGLRFSVSHTTRAPRPGERGGVDYHFVSEARFLQLRRRGAFLEWAEVDGALYGTSGRVLESVLARSEDVLLDIDTQGAAQVRRRHRDAVLVFVLPPGPGELKKRHRRRGTDPSTVERRMRLARREVARCGSYDYLVVNDRLETAVRDLAAIVRAERCRTARQRRRTEEIRRAFRSDSEVRPAGRGIRS